MDRPTGGLQERRGWGPETRGKSSVRDVFVHGCSSAGNVLAGAGALRGNKGMNIECLGLRDASSPGDSVTALFS